MAKRPVLKSMPPGFTIKPSFNRRKEIIKVTIEGKWFPKNTAVTFEVFANFEMRNPNFPRFLISKGTVIILSDFKGALEGVCETELIQNSNEMYVYLTVEASFGKKQVTAVLNNPFAFGAYGSSQG